MRFKLGFITGAAFGYWLSQNLSADQRRQLDERLRSAGESSRLNRVSGTVRDSAGRVADAVTNRVAGAASSAGEAVADKVGEPGTDGASTQFGKADRPPTSAEEVSAEKAAETAPDVGDTYDEMAHVGAETEGEGRVP